MPTDPDILQRMRSAFATISAWEAEHQPEDYAERRPGVSEEQLDAAENVVGYPLDHALRALYRVQNGSAGLHLPFEEADWEPLDRALEKHHQRSEDVLTAQELSDHLEWVSCEPPGVIQLSWNEPGWFPLGDNFSGDDLIVDHAPGPNGTRGQVIRCGLEDWNTPRTVIARSVLEYIERVAREIGEGMYEIDAFGDTVRIGTAWLRDPASD